MDRDLPIAVDAMGGDDAPESIVRGAVEAVENFDVSVLLVGEPEVLTSLLPASHDRISIKPASQVIPMGAEPASSVRKLKDSSVVRTMEAVKDGDACAALTAGNTGAAMASSLLRLGRIKGVARPAIALPFPVLNSTPTTLLDVGANADCLPEWLLQFAILGTAYTQSRFKVTKPRVGLLTIGEEAGKGNALSKEAAGLLEDGAWAETVGAEYIGNIEANELMTGAADVLVCDGFTGNVVLKALEGLCREYETAMRRELAQVAGASDVATPILKPLWDVYNSGNTGAAMLLGTRGVTMISHGSASSESIANAINTAKQLHCEGVMSNLRQAVEAQRQLSTASGKNR